MELESAGESPLYKDAHNLCSIVIPNLLGQCQHEYGSKFEREFLILLQ